MARTKQELKERSHTGAGREKKMKRRKMPTESRPAVQRSLRARTAVGERTLHVRSQHTMHACVITWTHDHQGKWGLCKERCWAPDTNVSCTDRLKIFEIEFLESYYWKHRRFGRLGLSRIIIPGENRLQYIILKRFTLSTLQSQVLCSQRIFHSPDCNAMESLSLICRFTFS